MSKKMKRATIGVAVFLLLTAMLAIPVFAQNLSKTIEVFYRDIKIYIDGDLKTLQDATGKIVEPFIYEGATYLPLRAFSEALGMAVEWDGASNSVFVGESDTQLFTEITVHTADELIAALGSNRRILLDEGVYNLTNANPGLINSAAVSFVESDDGPELVIDGVRNLTIQGIGETKSELVIEPRYAFVMRFQNCSNLNISNIAAGHTPEQGFCTGGVFDFENCSDIQIDNTDMYGCGTVGLNLWLVSNMRVTDSVIYACTQGIVYTQSCADISFEGCVFRDNLTYLMVGVRLTSGFKIDSCAFLRNTGQDTDYPSPMFSIEHSENVAITNTLFENNEAESLIEQPNIDFGESNTFVNNKFNK